MSIPSPDAGRCADYMIHSHMRRQIHEMWDAGDRPRLIIMNRGKHEKLGFKYSFMGIPIITKSNLPQPFEIQ